LALSPLKAIAFRGCSCCCRRLPSSCFCSSGLAVCRRCCRGAGKVLVGVPSYSLLQEPCSWTRPGLGQQCGAVRRVTTAVGSHASSSPIVQQHSWSWVQGEASHLLVPPSSQQAVSAQHTSVNPNKLDQ